MSNPILLTWKARPVRQYFDLSESEQKKLWDKHAEAVAASKVETILYCRSDWSHEKNSHFGVELYKDMDSLMKMKDILFSINWSSWIDSETMLSVPETPVRPVAPKTGGIFKMFYFRPTQAYYALSQAQRADGLVQLSLIQEQLGVKTIFTSAIFSSEHYLGAGLEHYPNLESLQEYSRRLVDMNFYQYVDSDIILGLQMEG